jgi:hypothetical protein
LGVKRTLSSQLCVVRHAAQRSKEVTRSGKYTYIEYARFADDLVILIDAHPRQDWLAPAASQEDQTTGAFGPDLHVRAHFLHAAPRSFRPRAVGVVESGH